MLRNVAWVILFVAALYTIVDVVAVLREADKAIQENQRLNRR